MAWKSAGRGVPWGLFTLMVAAAAFAQVPAAQHVVLVIDENSGYSDVIANMPWLVAHGEANGYAARYQSDNGGSLLDYLWLASGSCESSANCALPAGTHDFNCNGNNCYYPGTASSDAITDNNIFRELNNAGISWKVYAQSYTQAGGTVTTPDNNHGTAYYRRHNGATWYSDILDNVDGSASKIVDLWQLEIDLARGDLPRFMIIVPDGNHDAHDCPVGLSSCTEAQHLGAADAFLSSTLDPILSTPDFQPGGTGLILVTFDECGGGTDAGCGAAVYTALIGPRVTPHTVSYIPYKHENALRTILESLRLKTNVGAAAGVAAMSDFFTATGEKPRVIVSSPLGGALLSSPIRIQATAFPTEGHSITGWQVYVDSVSAYSAGTVASIHPTLKIGNGTHAIVVRAWESSGAFGDQTFTLTTTSLKPTVAVSTPANFENVGSPVNVQALASPTAGHTINQWSIFVDGVRLYHAGAASVISPNIDLSLGSHNIIVRAWDTSGAYDDQKVNVTVIRKPAIMVSAPVAGSNVISPINVRASGVASAGHSITRWCAYLDSATVYKAGAAASINANVAAVPGTHKLTVRVWDTSGAYGERTMSLEAQPVAVSLSVANGASVISPVKIAARAVSTHSIVGWHIYVDSVDSFAQGDGAAVVAELPMTAGAHAVVVRAWDSTGAYGDQTIQVTVP
jgi:Phosphoesterase family